MLSKRAVVRRLPAPVSLSWPHSKNRGAEEYYHGYKHNSCGADVAHEYASNRARFFSFLAMSPQNVTLSYTSALLLHIYPGGSSGGGGTESGSNKIYTHTRRAYLSMLIRNTHRLLLFQMQREKFCIKHGHTGNFLMPRAQKRVQKSSFVRAAQIRSCREGIL